MAKTALIVRPNHSSKKILYIPNAQIAPDVQLELLYSERQQHVASDEIVFVASRAAGNSEPSFAYDSASNVNGLFAGLT